MASSSAPMQLLQSATVPTTGMSSSQTPKPEAALCAPASATYEL